MILSIVRIYFKVFCHGYCCYGYCCYGISQEISEDDEDEEESIAMAIKGQKYGSSDDSKVVVQDVDL